MAIIMNCLPSFLAHLGMLTIFVAGVGKSLSFASFVISLGAWSLIPPAWTGVVAAGVVVCELTVSGLWFVGVYRHAAAIAAAGMVAIFTVAYAYEVLVSGPPTCECMGRYLAFRAEENRVTELLARNAMILVCLAFAIRRVPAVGKPSAQVAGVRRAGAGHVAGFTLVEVLMVIAAVSILAGLILTSLGPARASATTASSLSRLRQHTAVFHAYGADHRDGMPRFINPDGTHGPWGPHGRYLQGERLPYFIQSNLWPIAMEHGYYTGHRWRADVFYPPWAKSVELGNAAGSPYLYAATSVSRPEFWIESERTGPDQWKTVRFGEVAFPSQKVILSAIDHRVVIHDDRSRDETAHLGWIDGSASTSRVGDLEPGYPGGEGRFEGSWSFIADWPAGSHTRAGVRGRDIAAR